MKSWVRHCAHYAKTYSSDKDFSSDELPVTNQLCDKEQEPRNDERTTATVGSRRARVRLARRVVHEALHPVLTRVVLPTDTAAALRRSEWHKLCQRLRTQYIHQNIGNENNNKILRE